jgi:hypothetical protein
VHKYFVIGGEGEVSLQKKKERIVHLELIQFYYLSPEAAVLPAIPLALGVPSATPSSLRHHANTQP